MLALYGLVLNFLCTVGTFLHIFGVLRIKPRLERQVQPLEHFLLGAAEVGELLPLRDVLVFPSALNLDNVFLDQHLLIRKRLPQVLFAHLSSVDLSVFGSEEHWSYRSNSSREIGVRFVLLAGSSVKDMCAALNGMSNPGPR